MKTKISIGLGGLIAVFLFGIFLLQGKTNTTAMISAEENHESEEMNGIHGHEELLTTFGPGLGPSVHQISLRQFDNVKDIARIPNDVPPKITRKTPELVKISLNAKEVVSEIAPNITYLYWTFNETVPGPFLRVKEGDNVEITLSNDPTSGHNHSIDLHAVNGPGGGAAVTQVAPGENKTFNFKALNPGLYVYHCATPNVPTHTTNGMYGMILVEPIEGLPLVDKEFYIMQGELYTKGELGEQGYQPFSGQKMLDENPEYILLNGRVKALADNPLKANTGETIRIYAGNGGVSLTSNFHVIGEIFDTVYPEGSTKTEKNVQTTIIPAGGATIVEFKTDVPGTYPLVDHALARLDRGAWGLLKITGKENPTVFSSEVNKTVGDGHGG